MIYIIINFFNFILSNTGHKIHKLIFLCFLIILIGFRYNVGTDWSEYESVYNALNFQNFNISRFGFLFSFLMMIFKSLGLSFMAFSFVIFFISLVLIEKTISKFSKNYFFSFFIYLNTIFLIFHINGIRQGIALSIIFYSIKYILNNNKSRYMFSVILASFFHISAIIFLPVYWLRKLKINKIKLFFTILISLFILHFNPFSIMVENAAKYLNFENIVWYINNEYYNPINLFDVQVIARLFILLVLSFFIQKIKENTLLDTLFKIYLIGFLVYCFFSFNQDISYRLSFYFKIFEIILISNVGFYIKDRLKKFLFFITIFMVFFLSSIRIFQLPENGLTPFNFFF